MAKANILLVILTVMILRHCSHRVYFLIEMFQGEKILSTLSLSLRNLFLVVGYATESILLFALSVIYGTYQFILSVPSSLKFLLENLIALKDRNCAQHRS